MSVHDGMMVLRQANTENGLHPGDLLVEIKTATLANGTVEVPTSFENGQIVAVFAMRNGLVTIAADGTGAIACASDLVVTSGAITVVTTVNTYALDITVLIIGRPKI